MGIKICMFMYVKIKKMTLLKKNPKFGIFGSFDGLNFSLI